MHGWGDRVVAVAAVRVVEGGPGGPVLAQARSGDLACRRGVPGVKWPMCLAPRWGAGGAGAGVRVHDAGKASVAAVAEVASVSLAWLSSDRYVGMQPRCGDRRQGPLLAESHRGYRPTSPRPSSSPCARGSAGSAVPVATRCVVTLDLASPRRADERGSVGRARPTVPCAGMRHVSRVVPTR